MNTQWICTAASSRTATASALAALGLLCGILTASPAAQAFERHTCTEKWYDGNIHDSIRDRRVPYKTQDCPAPKDSETPIPTGYQVIDGRIFYVTSSSNRYNDCGGTGVGSLGKILMPKCYMPDKLQTHENVEERTFWLVSEDGAHLRTLASSQTNLTPVQRRSAASYAMDSTSVYLDSEKINGADPESFEVIFPFEDDTRLDRFSFARDRQHLFINGAPVPLLDLAQLKWLPVPCTGEKMECDNTQYSAPMIGKVGRDILYLDYGTSPTVFPGLATPDVECSRKGFKNYCASAGKRYLFDAGVMTPATLVVQPAE